MKNRAHGGIAETTLLNDIKHYIVHYPSSNVHAPVLLYIHGGPGFSTTPLSPLFASQYTDFAHVVFFDQRGAARTRALNPKAPVSTSLILQDMRYIVSYLKERYNTFQVILLGHSWGTVLSGLYALEHPHDICANIAIGQMVSVLQGIDVTCRELTQRIGNTNAKDSQTVAAISQKAKNATSAQLQKLFIKMQKLQKKYAIHMKFDKSLLKLLFHSPFGSLADMTIYQPAIQKATQPLFETLFSPFSFYDYPLHYDVPVYYIMGREDYITPLSVANAYYQKIEAPHKYFYNIGGGHMPMIEAPQDFFAALQDAVSRAICPQTERMLK